MASGKHGAVQFQRLDQLLPWNWESAAAADKLVA
jgi:hypothetical protein